MPRSLLLLAVAFAGACVGRGAPSGGNGVGRAELREAPALRTAGGLGADSATGATAWLRQQRSALGLGPRADFAYLRTTRGSDGSEHVRLQQLHDGVAVYGSDVVVHPGDGDAPGLSGTLLTALDGLDLAPALGEEVARNLARADVADRARGGSIAADEPATLVILPLDDGTAHLAWQVTLATAGRAGVRTGDWRYFVDAHDGSIVRAWNALASDVVEASGTGGNARVTRRWNMNLDVTPSGAGYVMDTPQYETIDFATNQPFSSAALANFNPTDPSANDAHGFAEITIKMLKQWQGFDSIDNKGFKLVSVAHAPDPDTGAPRMNNAFWDGEKMNYGDGDGTTFYAFTGAMDVVAHEIDHGFTQFHSNLAYTDQAGGMNESFSDIAGATAMFFLDAKTASFQLGADLFIKPGQAFRDMCTPSVDGRSIDNASQMRPGLDPHFSSGVMNRAFCRAARRLSGVDLDKGAATVDGVRRAAKAWYEANATRWTATSTWIAGCQGVIDAATALGFAPGELSALGDSWKDVGVSCRYTHVEDFVLTLAPATATANAGSSATFTVTTTVPPGQLAQPLVLSVDGLSSGVTGTFAPSSVMSGGTATLTLAVPANAPGGDVAFTVKAAGGVTHVATATLKVVAPSSGSTPGNSADNSNGAGHANADQTGTNTGSFSGGCSFAGAEASTARGLWIVLALAVVIALGRRRRGAPLG